MLSEVIESVCKEMPFTRLKLDRFSSFSSYILNATIIK